MHPSDDTTLVNLGLVWEEVELPMRALETYTLAIGTNPKSAAAYVRLGAALETHLAEREMAVEAATTAVGLDPSRADAWNLLGTLQHSSGKLDLAREAFRSALDIAPDSVDILDHYATVLRAMGRFDESIVTLSSALTLEPEHANVRSQLAFSPPLDLNEEEPMKNCSMPVQGRVAAVVDPSALPETTPVEWHDRLRSVHISHILNESECKWVVDMAERHAAEQGGWDSAGHHAYHPTNDIVVSDCPELLAWLRKKLVQQIWPTVMSQFGLEAEEELWLEDCFVVKYDADGQPGLGEHADDSEISFNLLLSDPASFEGGGTLFADAQPEPVTVRPRCGEMLSHYGRLKHEGRAVLGGAPRYILAGFVRCSTLAKLRPHE